MVVSWHCSARLFAYCALLWILSDIVEAENPVKVAAGDVETICIVVENLKPGEYAIAVFQAINATEKLAANCLGIPQEP